MNTSGGEYSDSTARITATERAVESGEAATIHGLHERESPGKRVEPGDPRPHRYSTGRVEGALMSAVPTGNAVNHRPEVSGTHSNVVHIAPPLSITEEEADEGAAILGTARRQAEGV